MLNFDTDKTCWQALSWHETPAMLMFHGFTTDTTHFRLHSSKTALLDTLKENRLYHGPLFESITTFPHHNPEGERFSSIRLDRNKIPQVTELGEIFFENFPVLPGTHPSFLEAGGKEEGDMIPRNQKIFENNSIIFEFPIPHRVKTEKNSNNTAKKGNPAAIKTIHLRSFLTHGVNNNIWSLRIRWEYAAGEIFSNVKKSSLAALPLFLSTIFCPRISTNFHELLFATNLHVQIHPLCSLCPLWLKSPKAFKRPKDATTQHSTLNTQHRRIKESS